MDHRFRDLINKSPNILFIVPCIFWYNWTKGHEATYVMSVGSVALCESCGVMYGESAVDAPKA